MNTKLIIIEGLPGFGKSTTAKLINDILSQNNVETELFLEGNLDHPADYDGVSCFSKSQFDRLISISGNFKEVFLDRAIKKGSDFLLPYRKIKNEFGDKFSDELLNAIFENDIYELPFEQNEKLIVSKWEEFAKNAFNENKVYIFECCFIQNPLTIGMLKYGVKDDKIIDYVIKLKKAVETLNPLLFYVEQDDLEYSFKKAVTERPKEWSEGFIEYCTKQGYGKKHGYEGIEGTIKVLGARKDLELKIFDILDLEKVKINNSKYEVENYKLKIVENLKSII